MKRSSPSIPTCHAVGICKQLMAQSNQKCKSCFVYWFPPFAAFLSKHTRLSVSLFYAPYDKLILDKLAKVQNPKLKESISQGLQKQFSAKIAEIFYKNFFTT